MNLSAGIKLLIAALILGAGCASSSVMSRTYDFAKVERVGIMRFNDKDNAVPGCEDIFAREFMKNGVRVVERARIKQVLDELKMSASGLTDPQNTQKLGKILGVNVLLMGDVTFYPSEKRKMDTVITEQTFREPVYSEVDERQPDGSYKKVLKKTGENVRKEKTASPNSYYTLPSVGVIAKLVDVETAEIVWVGTITKSGINAQDAATFAVSSLVKDLVKQYKKSLKNK